jgi:hypothetical protein
MEQGQVTDFSRSDDAGEKDHVRHDGSPRTAVRAARCPAPSRADPAAFLMSVSVTLSSFRS